MDIVLFPLLTTIVGIAGVADPFPPKTRHRDFSTRYIASSLITVGCTLHAIHNLKQGNVKSAIIFGAGAAAGLLCLKKRDFLGHNAAKRNRPIRMGGPIRDRPLEHPRVCAWSAIAIGTLGAFLTSQYSPTNWSRLYVRFPSLLASWYFLAGGNGYFRIWYINPIVDHKNNKTRTALANFECLKKLKKKLLISCKRLDQATFTRNNEILKEYSSRLALSFLRKKTAKGKGYRITVKDKSGNEKTEKVRFLPIEILNHIASFLEFTPIIKPEKFFSTFLTSLLPKPKKFTGRTCSKIMKKACNHVAPADFYNRDSYEPNLIYPPALREFANQCPQNITWSKFIKLLNAKLKEAYNAIDDPEHTLREFYTQKYTNDTCFGLLLLENCSSKVIRKLNTLKTLLEQANES